MKKGKNFLLRAEKIQQIIRDNYQPERQDKCKLAVYRNFVQKIYPMSERTFWRYANAELKDEPKQEVDKNQLKLFDM